MNDKVKGCGIGCLIALGIAIIVPVIFIIIGSIAAKSLIHSPEKEKTEISCGKDEHIEFDEIWSTGTKNGKKFVRIAINGVIDLSRNPDNIFASEAGTPAFALDSIKAATVDGDVCGIILELDTPGGGVTDSDIIYNALCKFKEAGTNRVVFVLAGDLCASGGYYVSSAADYIMAHPTSVLGSIGVIIPGINIKGLADKIGIKEDSISTGANKKLGVLGDMTPEQRAIKQAIVDDMYTRFVGLVAKGRNMPEEKVREIADGSIFSATKCLELGLVDSIGYYDDLVEKILESTGCDSIHVVRYAAPKALEELFGFGEIFGQAFGQAVIKSVTESNVSRRQFLYDGK